MQLHIPMGGSGISALGYPKLRIQTGTLAYLLTVVALLFGNLYLIWRMDRLQTEMVDLRNIIAIAIPAPAVASAKADSGKRGPETLSEAPIQPAAGQELVPLPKPRR
jgi:hypothetical protein